MENAILRYAAFAANPNGLGQSSWIIVDCLLSDGLAHGRARNAHRTILNEAEAPAFDGLL
jgi:hypothetical protein